MWKVWRNALAVKSTTCSSQGLMFNSQHLQPSVIQIPGDPAPLLPQTPDIHIETKCYRHKIINETLKEEKSRKYLYL